MVDNDSSLVTSLLIPCYLIGKKRCDTLMESKISLPISLTISRAF